MGNVYTHKISKIDHADGGSIQQRNLYFGQENILWLIF